MSQSHIRNFCVIAHIDHGKSTLADRLLEVTGTIMKKDMQEQVLDSMDLERERGITIKMHPIRMNYKSKSGQEYVFNLIDTPGHVDFGYEVSRSLAACEGAILVVDATQGVEAQTVANLYQAVNHNLTIIPVINKVDLPSAEVERSRTQIVELLGCDPSEILLASAKTGLGIQELLEEVIIRVPAPKGDGQAPLKALIFDCIFDIYRGAVPYLRMVDGSLKKGMQIKLFSNEKIFEVTEVGILKLGMYPKNELLAGEVGYVVAGIKTVSDARVGDTVTDAARPAPEALPGYKQVKPMVYAGLYPTENQQYPELREALEKLTLNDSALHYQPETSSALGFGFRCGFLGMLHLEIVQERLEREYNLSLINTVPNVEYRVIRTDGQVLVIDNPSDLPNEVKVEQIEEPFVNAEIVVPAEFIGNIMKLGQDRRGIYQKLEYLDPTRALLFYQFPLSEIIFDFYDKLKSLSKGYASLDYEFLEYRQSDLVKLDILINGDPLDALSAIIHQDHAQEWGKRLAVKLRRIIPRQQYEVAIQAAIGSRIIARESVKPYRKNVIAKCYGGDISRKRKLLEKQKEGKKRMKQVGNVEIPQEAFLAVLKVGDEESE
ncbi:elongation factor 4 [candidate division TA06 bacterium]|uniref:Elongation factor 4 n=1 Tax=candidate division TA06 bacterium TaxID=2250710 RepID=A0A933MJ47_UNCT6|nr:elongation factor 4 [candidate division TA06 bacterium]